MSELKAVIFDFDGVICDSEMLHFEAFNEILDDYDTSVTKDQYLRDYLGLSDNDFYHKLIDEGRLNLPVTEVPAILERKKQAYEKIAETKANVIDGVIEFLEMLHTNKIKMAICSGALLPEIEHVLKKGGLEKYFQTIVSAEQVENGKPAPDGFLTALERINEINKINITPGECLVVEDSTWGLKAANAAGMKCIAVTNSYPAEELQQADMIVESLATNTLEQLNDIM